MTLLDAPRATAIIDAVGALEQAGDVANVARWPVSEPAAPARPR